MKTFGDMTLAEVRAWGDDAYAELVRQRHGELARMTLDEIADMVTGLGGSAADAVKVFTVVAAEIAPYTRQRIHPAEILAA